MGNAARLGIVLAGVALAGCIGAGCHGAGCSGAASSPPGFSALPSPTDLADLGLATPVPWRPWRGLDALSSAQIRLPIAAAVPEGAGVFPLPGPWVPGGRAVGRLRSFKTPLPFRNDMPRPNYAPLGARLFRGESELGYINNPKDILGGGWLVDHDDLVVFSMEDPARWRAPPELRVPELAEALRKRQWTGSGDPADFVRSSVTSNGITRPGLLLPAGASISFSLRVAEGTPERAATLDFGLMGESQLAIGGGAVDSTVVWRVDGTEVGRDRVSPGGLPLDHRESLARWAGQTVSLSFEVEGGEGVGNVVITAPTVSAPAERAPRHVIVVGIDTLRQDALGTYGYARATSPELDAWADQSVVFDAAWTPAPRTRPSFRSAFTGHYPLAAADAPNLAEHLSAAGFRTAGVVANVHLVPRFGFDDGFEHWVYENGARAEAQVERALAWQTQHADEDTFLFLHLMDPHTFYDAPDPYASRFQTGARPQRLPKQYERWQIYQVMKQPWFNDSVRAWIRGEYDGEIAYTSATLAGFFGAIEALGGQTLTVVHSDHGEELWDHGGFEHNHSLYEELVRSVLWIRAPGGQSGERRVAAPVGLIDIVPTVLDLLGIRVGATGVGSTDGRSLAAFIDPARVSTRDSLTTALTERPLMLGHLMFGAERWGVVWRGTKYLLHTATGQEELYDLTADRAEQHDLAPAASQVRLEELRHAMQEASGWPVRAGWRFALEGRAAPITLRFDAPIAAAGVVDPEAERETRANLEWGELPEVTRDQVGRIRVGEDQRTVFFTPGPRASGHRIWVTCVATCPAGTLEIGQSGRALLGAAPLTAGPIEVGATRVDVRPGTLLEVPEHGEAHAPATAGQLEALKQLGYVDGG